VAGLVGGATSMAAGEYVSVSSQRDAERADSSQERRDLAADPASSAKPPGCLVPGGWRYG
jgi:VIT1/CCC1 family predicted Fe2+/Mn2+ transporter